MLLKYHYDRVRPNYLDTTLEPSISVPGHPAYPSGHATQAAAIALVLGCVDPDNKAEYILNRVGYNRELGGVHYPSDSVAGEKLAEAMVEEVAAFVGLSNEQIAGCSWTLV